MTESGKWEYKYFKDANTYTIITKAEYDYAVSIGGKHETAELKDLLLKERAYNRLANKYGYKDAEDIMLSVKEAEKQGLEANAKELWEYYELAKSYDKWSKRLQNYYIYFIDNHFKEAEKEQEIKPIGKGEFGNIYDQFKGKPKEAVEFLKEKKEGEVLEALYHKDVGYIDLVWGKEGTARSDGYGLSKLIKYHPEVVDNLQEIINDMHITKRTENRIQLESDKYKASVRLTWNNERKTWLLTAFQKNSVSDNTTDTDETLKGKRNATATSQNTISNGKDTTKIGNSIIDEAKERIKNEQGIEKKDYKEKSEAELILERPLLTEEEIRESSIEDELKTLAISYIKGNSNFVNQIAYINTYNNVRRSKLGGVGENSNTEGRTTQLDSGHNNGRERLRSGVQSMEMDSTGSGEDVPGTKESSLFGNGGVAEGNGERSDKQDVGREAGDKVDTTGSEQRMGSGDDRGIGHNDRGRKRNTAGDRNDGKNSN